MELFIPILVLNKSINKAWCIGYLVDKYSRATAELLLVLNFPGFIINKLVILTLAWSSIYLSPKKMSVWKGNLNIYSDMV